MTGPADAPLALPLAGDGLLPPPGLVRALARAGGRARAQLPLLPPHNGWLPDALADAGVGGLAVPGLGGARWRGEAGGTILLNGGGDALEGELVRPWIPPPPGPDRVGEERVAAARAVWSLGLAAEAAVAGAWAANPFPVARAALLRLTGAAPPALRSGDGALHPVQATADGAMLCRLELDGLAAVALAPCGAAVPGARWEVGADALDNGRVRAELDASGRLARLSGDGAYAAWRAPALALALKEGDCGPGRVSVRESGPVRATLLIARPEGDLEISALAHEAVITVRVVPRISGLALTLPLEAAVALEGDGVSARPWERDRPALLRWAFLGDGRGDGVAITCDRAASATRDARGVRIAIARELVLRLHPAARLSAPGPWWDAAADHAPHLALDALAGTSAAAPPPRPPRWRLWCPPGVVAGWCGVDGDAIELVLHELLGGRARPTLHLGRADEDGLAVSVKTLGGEARALERGDGMLSLPLGPRGTLVARLAPRA